MEHTCRGTDSEHTRNVIPERSQMAQENRDLRDALRRKEAEIQRLERIAKAGMLLRQAWLQVPKHRTSDSIEEGSIAITGGDFHYLNDRANDVIASTGADIDSDGVKLATLWNEESYAWDKDTTLDEDAMCVPFEVGRCMDALVDAILGRREGK